MNNLQIIPHNQFRAIPFQSPFSVNGDNCLVNKLEKVDWDFLDAKPSSFSVIHPYPAKYISEIPSTLIDYLWKGQGDYILDPFCGSGVTLEAAQQRGITSIGVDLNPIACLISRVRTNELDDDFFPLCKTIVEACASYCRDVCVPKLPNIDHWFMPEIQQSLSRLKMEIDKFQNSKWQDALEFCFSSVIVKVSNQDSDTRYAFKDKKKTSNDVYNYFLQSAKKLVKSKQDVPIVESSVINKNVLRLTYDDIPGNIGMVITSPPYPNAYEYWLYHKYRMYWLGFNPIEVKNEEIGARAHYFKKPRHEGYDFNVQMKELLDFLYPVCSDGAYLCFVIGRSKIHNRIYNNDDIIKEVGKSRGYYHVTTLMRNMNNSRKSFNLNHARIKEEYIVILRK